MHLHFTAKAAAAAAAAEAAVCTCRVAGGGAGAGALKPWRFLRPPRRRTRGKLGAIKLVSDFDVNQH